MGLTPPTTWGGSLGLTLREALKTAGGKVGLTIIVLAGPKKTFHGVSKFALRGGASVTLARGH